MTTLRIHHTVPSFDEWRRVFDSDPIDRKGSGVRAYAIRRSATDANFVAIDLEFSTVEEAEQALDKLRALWAGTGSSLVRSPEAWIMESIESPPV